ncbi:winged helix-turn-helix transcriptional regulator [Aquimarina spongiae]|uniref:Transcriptional regulator, HxlR family n=1 Tax=Aquimarina spongiae TaxID=570521 RepID=A0A1M6GJD7_9FLAO|nr:helix-turn-helix domain-containing protein [Aquimarina spongiae]SHJ10085.1 transcriptional regulator, HxlR family [Aquimarina spongiae]
MKKEDFLSATCSVTRALLVIGGKWSLRVIDEIGKEKKRYGELKKGIPQISEKMLIQELKLLTQNGILERKSYHEVPPRVEYSLTQLGLQTLPILDQIKVFGDDLLKTSANKM